MLTRPRRAALGDGRDRGVLPPRPAARIHVEPAASASFSPRRDAGSSWAVPAVPRRPRYAANSKRSKALRAGGIAATAGLAARACPRPSAGRRRARAPTATAAPRRPPAGRSAPLSAPRSMRCRARPEATPSPPLRSGRSSQPQARRRRVRRPRRRAGGYGGRCHGMLAVRAAAGTRPEKRRAGCAVAVAPASLSYPSTT